MAVKGSWLTSVTSSGCKLLLPNLLRVYSDGPRDGYNRGLLQGGFTSRSEIDCCPLASSGISKTPISDKGIELESGAVSDWSESRGRQQRFCGVGEGVC